MGSAGDGGFVVLPSIAAVAANLLFVTAARKVPHAYRGPTEVTHYGGQAAASARTTAALRNLQQIKNCLGRNPFDSVVAELTAKALKTDAPGFRILCLCLSLSFLHYIMPWQIQ
jgi:hypothetical protein